MLANNLLGEGWLEKIKNGDTSFLDTMAFNYGDVVSKISGKEDAISNNEQKIAQIEDYITSVINEEMEVSAALDAIQDLLLKNTGNTEKPDTPDSANPNGKKGKDDTLTEKRDGIRKFGDQWVETSKAVSDSTGTIVTTIDTMTGDVKTSLETSISTLNTYVSELQNISNTCSSMIASINTAMGSIQGIGQNLSSTTPLLSLGAGVGAAFSAISGTNSSAVLSAKLYHSGAENGLVNNTTVPTGDAVRIIALDKLNPDEIPAILKTNELVVNNLQQSNILSNLGSSYLSGFTTGLGKNNSNQTISYQLGDIHVYDVEDSKGLAGAIVTDLLQQMNQKLYA